MAGKDLLTEAKKKHNSLCIKLDGMITPDSFQNFKRMALTYLDQKLVEKANSVHDLLHQLEIKGVFSVGNYDNLIDLMELAGIGIVINVIKETQKEIQTIMQSSIHTKVSGGATASSSSDGSVDYISSLRPYQKRLQTVKEVLSTEQFSCTDIINELSSETINRVMFIQPEEISFEDFVPIDIEQNGAGRKWKICSRITNKSRIAPYREKNRWDQHLNFTFTDASGSINAVAFGQTADKFNRLLKEQKVYYVSNATIEQGKMKSKGGNAYEMILTDDTNIKLCEEEDSLALPTQIPFKSVMIDKLEPGKLYDVIGVVKDHREKTVKEWHGIDVQIVDQSKKMVSLNLSKKDVEKLDLRGNPVLAVNGAFLKHSYGHVYLKMMPNSKLRVNPADIPETDLLKRWFENEGRQIEFEKI